MKILLLFWSLLVGPEPIPEPCTEWNTFHGEDMTESVFAPVCYEV